MGWFRSGGEDGDLLPGGRQVRRRVRGITLVELAAAMATLAIVTAIGVPALRSLVETARADAATSAVTRSFALARIAAVSRGIPVSVCPSVDGRRCRGSTDWTRGWIVFLDATRSGQPASPGDLLEVVGELDSGIAATSTSGRSLVRFQPGGWSPGFNLTVRVCAANLLKRRVIVNNAGRSRVERLTTETACPFRA